MHQKITQYRFAVFIFAVVFTLSGIQPLSATSISETGTGSEYFSLENAYFFEDCFGADKGAASTDKQAHINWARSQATSTLVSNLTSKVYMVFGCTAVSDDQAVRAFGEISGVIARRVAEPVRVTIQNCFRNDPGAGNGDDSVHAGWARSKKKSVMADNLAGKIKTAYGCLKQGEPQAELFAAVSQILATVPVGATGASASDCSGRAYSIAQLNPVKVGTYFPINWSAPRGHPGNDFLGVFKANTSLSDPANRTTWSYLASDGSPCGIVNLWAIYGMTAGEYDVYIFHWGSTTPVSNGVRLVVKP